MSITHGQPSEANNPVDLLVKISALLAGVDALLEAHQAVGQVFQAKELARLASDHISELQAIQMQL